MSSLKQRLLTTLLGIPLLLIVIFLLPQFGHLAFAIVAIGFTLLGSKEIYQLIEKKFDITPNLPFYLTGLLPLSAWISSITNINNLVDLCFVFLLILSFAIEIYDGTKQETPFQNSFLKISINSFSLLYPGYLLSFIIKLNTFESVSSLYALFLLAVFSNDIFAYVFGMLFGKNSRGFIKASPNKSVVGFVGGIISSILISIVATLLFKVPITIIEAGILGLTISFSANIGDLIESVIKRSTSVKDTGSFIPGRGGALDNLDSLLTSAPVFYLLIEIFIR
ncbi:MAG: phosphatidate cytidylyltransferase [Pleomorphochaeta sp.]